MREGDPKYDPETRIINLGKAEQTVTKDQAGTKAREYTINMYKYVRGKDKGKSQKVMSISICHKKQGRYAR